MMSVPSGNVVLVAEVQIFVRGAAADVLNDHGYEVIEVGSSEEALAVLAERSRDIRALFTDISMPGSLDGLALAHTLRSYPRVVGFLRKPMTPPSWLCM
jgi:CheY-like chemotaxis protein